MSNDPVLLLHGQPGAAAEWEHVRASIGDGMRTIAFDRPGWDRRSAVRDLAGNAERGAGGPRSGRRRAGDGGRAQPRGGGRGVARVVESRARAAGWCWSRRRPTSSRSAPATTCWPRRRSAGSPASGRWRAAASCSAPARCGDGSQQATALDDRYLRAAGRTLLSPYTWRSFVREQRLLVRDLPGARAPAGSDLGADDGARRHRRHRRADRGGAAARRPDSRGRVGRDRARRSPAAPAPRGRGGAGDRRRLVACSPAPSVLTARPAGSRGCARAPGRAAAPARAPAPRRGRDSARSAPPARRARARSRAPRARPGFRGRAPPA